MPNPTVYLTSDELEQIDNFADATGRTRSGVIREALDRFWREVEEPTEA